MTLPCSALLSNFKYSSCAFLPGLIFSAITRRQWGKPEICEYLNIWNLGTVLANIATPAFPFSRDFAGSTCWLRKIHKKCSQEGSVCESSKFQRGYRLSNNNGRDFDARLQFRTLSITRKKQKSLLKDMQKFDNERY